MSPPQGNAGSLKGIALPPTTDALARQFGARSLESQCTTNPSFVFDTSALILAYSSRATAFPTELSRPSPFEGVHVEEGLRVGRAPGSYLTTVGAGHQHCLIPGESKGAHGRGARQRALRRAVVQAKRPALHQVEGGLGYQLPGGGGKRARRRRRERAHPRPYKTHHPALH